MSKYATVLKFFSRVIKRFLAWIRWQIELTCWNKRMVNWTNGIDEEPGSYPKKENI